jgi:hypothetical protein
MTLLHGVVYHNLNHSSLVVKGRMRLRIEEESEEECMKAVG